MSIYHSDKCTQEELQVFKKEVIVWLNDNFDIDGMKIKAFSCYNGDVRLYTGEYNNFPNSKSSFRREKKNYDDKGNIIGYHGTRGIHSTRYAEYLSFNRDEFSQIKNAYKNPQDDNYDFYQDLIFRRLKIKK